MSFPFSYLNSLHFFPRDERNIFPQEPHPYVSLQTTVKMLLDKLSVLNCLPFSEEAFQTFQGFYWDILQHCFCSANPRSGHILWKWPRPDHVQREYHVCAPIRPHRVLLVHHPDPAFISFWTLGSVLLYSNFCYLRCRQSLWFAFMLISISMNNISGMFVLELSCVTKYHFLGKLCTYAELILKW